MSGAFITGLMDIFGFRIHIFIVNLNNLKMCASLT